LESEKVSEFRDKLADAQRKAQMNAANVEVRSPSVISIVIDKTRRATAAVASRNFKTKSPGSPEINGPLLAKSKASRSKL
jgi:hypothetical protein